MRIYFSAIRPILSDRVTYSHCSFFVRLEADIGALPDYLRGEEDEKSREASLR